MAVGSDKKILGKTEEVKGRGEIGRPKASRDLARRLFQAGFTSAQIAKRLGNSTRTVRRIRTELEAAGILEPQEREETPNIIAADFDEECRTATGMSFLNWIKTKRTDGQSVFNFCSLVWEEVWDRPSLVLMRDDNNNLAQVKAQEFMDHFGEDKPRIRRRKKFIRRLFAFLGRRDINDLFFTMTNYQDPRRIRKVPGITLSKFPANLEKAIAKFEELHGWKAMVYVRSKIALQSRTGHKGKGRGIAGLSKDSQTPSYLLFNGPDSFQGNLLEKQREEWAIEWLPKEVRHDLYKLSKEPGDYYFGWSQRDQAILSKSWKKITKEITGEEIEFHDLRKISITWLFVMKVPLEIATMINVGWKDLNTARDHYLHLRGLLKRDERAAYEAEIPSWFKDGLDQYTKE